MPNIDGVQLLQVFFVDIVTSKGERREDSKMSTKNT
jgi:hypothetical protein